MPIWLNRSRPTLGRTGGESYREREQRLDRAAKAKFAAGADEYAWVADFTDSQAVIIRNGGTAGGVWLQV